MALMTTGALWQRSALPGWRQSLSSWVTFLQKQYFCSGSDADIYKEAQREAAHLCQPAQAQVLGLCLHFYLWLRHKCWAHPHHTAGLNSPSTQTPEVSVPKSMAAVRGCCWERENMAVVPPCLGGANTVPFHSSVLPSGGDNFWHSLSSNPHCT